MKALPTFTELPIAEITVPQDRLRPISEAKVAALMQVIGEGVFLGAITVRRAGKVNSLIDGGHRLEAMRRLGRETIRADVLECNASEARQLEVTGNLTAGMTPIQDAIFLGVYQAEYEKLHPETKGGVAGALAKNGLQRTNLSFADVVAEQRQVSDRTVRRIIAAGRSLTRDERDALQSVSHRIAISEIEKLGKIGDRPLRARAVEALLEGKKVAAAIRAAKAEESGLEGVVKDPVEEAFIALSKAWARAPMAAKKRFLINHRHEIWEAENKGDSLLKYLDREAGAK
ncbi:MAG: ParB N-terminal domain-containing protein [Tabrizicola sp.]|jgi:ParB family chromosome partitioning protein|nr:ParB N-terminal domain-containing protein [Tabrizicola sp.]